MRKGEKIKMCHTTSHKAFNQKPLVRGGFSWKGVTNLVFIDGAMKASNYLSTIEQNLLSKILKWYSGESCVFQQDNTLPQSAFGARISSAAKF